MRWETGQCARIIAFIHDATSFNYVLKYVAAAVRSRACVRARYAGKPPFCRVYDTRTARVNQPSISNDVPTTDAPSFLPLLTRVLNHDDLMGSAFAWRSGSVAIFHRFPLALDED